MGTTADKLNAILNTKEAIKQAIRDKGVYIGDYDAFADYPDAIRSIETGSGEGGSDAFFNMRTQNGTDFSYLFYCYTGSELDLSDWDTSQVTDMNSMFNYCTNLTSLNLNNWYTSPVTTMNSMFYQCGNLTSLDLSNFDTSNVNGMNCMFNSCSNLKELNISSFNTSNVNDMNSMFGYCYNLKSLDVSNFNTSNVTDIDSMFSWCYNLEELDIRNFNVNNIEYVNCMLEGCDMLHKLRLDNCNNDTIRRIIESSGFPTNAIEGVQRKIYVQEANITGLTAPTNWIFVDLDGNEIEPEEPEITIPLYVPGKFQERSELTEVTTMVNNTHDDLTEMFAGCTNLTTINGIEQWDTSNVTNMNSMFSDCNKLTSLNLSGFNTSNVTDMSAMFINCTNLKRLDLSNFDMSKTDTSFMFYDCNKLQELRLDNCGAETVEKIIYESDLPTNTITGVTRKIYVKQANAAGLTAPTNWVFEYIG